MTSKPTWVDPPEGWRWGFPKLCPADQVHRMSDWLIESGYPEEQRDSYGKYFHVRCWHEGE